MKENDVPQDRSILGSFKRACYCIAEDGKYKIVKSNGWIVEKIVNTLANEEFENELEIVKDEVNKKKTSPIKYYMLKNKMDINILSDYTGFFKWTIKRHFMPSFFCKINEKDLKIYSSLFGLSVEELKEFNLR